MLGFKYILLWKKNNSMYPLLKLIRITSYFIIYLFSNCHAGNRSLQLGWSTSACSSQWCSTSLWDRRDESAYLLDRLVREIHTTSQQTHRPQYGECLRKSAEFNGHALHSVERYRYIEYLYYLTILTLIMQEVNFTAFLLKNNCSINFIFLFNFWVVR